MDSVRRGLNFSFVYQDDNLVVSCSTEEHYKHILQLFQRLSDHGLVINPAGNLCVFGNLTWPFLATPSMLTVYAHIDLPQVDSQNFFLDILKFLWQLLK